MNTRGARERTRDYIKKALAGLPADSPDRAALTRALEALDE